MGAPSAQPVGVVPLSGVLAHHLPRPHQRSLHYRALRYIDLSKASLLHASQPLFVALFGLIVFGTLPDLRQWFGGALVLVGVYLLLIGRPRKTQLTNDP